MDAPIYPPAVAFEQPVTTPYVLSTETASLEELMSSPVAWAIVLKYAPFLEIAVKSAQMKPYLGNFTMATFLGLGMVDQKTIDAIDQDLARLPRSQWPAQ